MARPLRVEYPGAYYHVINRGNNQEKIFKDNAREVAIYLARDMTLITSTGRSLPKSNLPLKRFAAIMS